ncbi:aggregation-promoting factor C-terminal-like domain-containing protein [Streptosporangium soli]
MIIFGVTLVVLVGGGGFTAYTAVQNANTPADPLTLADWASLMSGDPYAPDPAADALKEQAVQAMKKDALVEGRDRKGLNAVVIPTQAPGGDGFLPKNFPPGSDPDPGSNKAVAKEMLSARGWGDSEWGCLERLWMKESTWNERAMNPSSGAYGIPQALPGGKMASAGADWQTNPATQIKWGLGYIAGRYKTPCGAWAHSMAKGWY